MSQLPQPFNQEEIRRDPKAVVIALLIGLLLIFATVIGILYYGKESEGSNCQRRIEKLYKQMVDSRNERIALYEQMIFYKKKSEDLQKRDSLLKGKTEPLMQRIYNYENLDN